MDIDYYIYNEPIKGSKTREKVMSSSVAIVWIDLTLKYGSLYERKADNYFESLSQVLQILVQLLVFWVRPVRVSHHY